MGVSNLAGRHQTIQLLELDGGSIKLQPFLKSTAWCCGPVFAPAARK
jgi:hypothetical protein